jgi:hypothetical protein
MTITLTREEAQSVLDDLEALTAYIQGIDKGIVLKTQSIETLRARLSAPERNCTRSHPHENMDVMCELRTEIARLTNENARLKSQPEPEPVTDKYLMEVECTKCGAKQDGVLTVTVPPQPEPSCKTGSQCIGGKCPQCVVSEPEPVAWLHSFTGYGWQVVPEKLYPTDQPLYTTPPQREWQGLTDKEITELWEAPGDSGNEFARAIEAKLKEKNSD